MLQTLSTLEDVQKMYDWFEEMRNTQPVWLDESSGCWHVFRSDDVLHVISDATLFRRIQTKGFLHLHFFYACLPRTNRTGT
jgi:hypothetical protein